MYTIDITNLELFSIELDYMFGDESVQLDNFYCTNVYENRDTLTFNLKTQKEQDLSVTQIVRIMFKDYKFNLLDYPLEHIKNEIVINLQRCRYEKNKKLFEVDDYGRFHYLIEFVGEIASIELFARQVILEYFTLPTELLPTNYS